MFPPNAYPRITSWTSGMTIETRMSVGLRRKRRRSRSMMARIRCMASPSLHDERTLGGGGRLQRVAQIVPGVMDKDVVQRRALHGERGHGDAGFARGVEHVHRGLRAVVGGNAE